MNYKYEWKDSSCKVHFVNNCLQKRDIMDGIKKIDTFVTSKFFIFFIETKKIKNRNHILWHI